MYEIPYLPFEVYQVYKVYEFYDEPLVYSFVDKKGNLYLANWADWDEENEVNTWVYFPVSKIEINELEKQKYTQKELFERSHNENVYVVTEGDTDEKYYISKVHALNGEWIPGEDSYLEDMDLEENSKDNVYELVEGTVIESNRYIVNLSLDQGNHEKEIDSTVLGEFLIDYQNLINVVSLGRDATTRSRVPEEIEEDNRLMVTDTFAASFGIRLESANYATMLYDDRIADSIRSVQRLLSLDNEKEMELDSLLIDNFNEKAMEAYINLLAKIHKYQTSLKSETLLPTAGMNLEKNVAKMDSKRSLKIINLIDNKQEIKTEILTIYGELYSINNRLKTFQFQEKSKKNQEDVIYRGSISNVLLEVVFEVPSKGTATIKVVKTINPYRHTEKAEYFLMDWEQD